MLRQRIVTALVLIALLLPALLATSPWPFAALTLVFIGAAGWEWGRLNQAGAIGSLVIGGALAVACTWALVAGLTLHPPALLWWTAAVAWCVGGSLALRQGVAAWSRWPLGLRWVLGLVALWAAWLAISHARTRGLNFLLSVFCLVWAADIAAYFGGRAFGKRKLAPSISPGKSWAGAYSGWAGVLVLALAWAAFDSASAQQQPSLFTLLAARWGLLGMVVCVTLLSALSVVGDLLESLVKRAAGAKDSSQLLPGHGGVLDRLDALLPTFPVALALVS